MSTRLMFPRPAVSPRAFADAAGRLAGAVAIVAWNPGAPQGVLIKTVSLLSTHPPRVLFAVEKDAPGHAGLLQTQDCAINLLSDAEEPEAERFAQAALDAERFSPARWRLQADRPPRLITGAAHLAGVIDQRIDAGSHSLFMVRVEDVEVHDCSPLVHFDRGFRRLQPARQTAGAQVCAMQEG